MRLRYVIFLGMFWLLYKMFNHSAWFHMNTLIFWWSSFITWIYIKRQPSHCRSIWNCTPLWTRTPASQIIILKFCQSLFKKSRIPGKPMTRHGAQHILTIISWCQCTIALWQLSFLWADISFTYLLYILYIVAYISMFPFHQYQSEVWWWFTTSELEPRSETL